MKKFIEKRRKLFGFAGGLVAFGIAVIYLKVIPQETSAVSGLQKVILIYGHSACWFFLSIASILWALMKENKWSKTLAYLALAVYAVFICMLLVIRSV